MGVLCGKGNVEKLRHHRCFPPPLDSACRDTDSGTVLWPGSGPRFFDSEGLGVENSKTSRNALSGCCDSLYCIYHRIGMISFRSDATLRASVSVVT